MRVAAVADSGLTVAVGFAAVGFSAGREVVAELVGLVGVAVRAAVGFSAGFAAVRGVTVFVALFVVAVVAVGLAGVGRGVVDFSAGRTVARVGVVEVVGLLVAAGLAVGLV